MERVKIEDYLKHESVNDVIKEADSKSGKNYVRFLIRGKRGRGVPVMLNHEEVAYLNTFLCYRKKANVSSSNPYVFGIPGPDKVEHLHADRLMNRYSLACGAKNPKTLRGTKLRKHFATKCGMMELGDVEICDVADYMGHHEKIHLEHYRLPNAARDILRMSNILERAQGVGSDENIIDSPERENSISDKFEPEIAVQENTVGSPISNSNEELLKTSRKSGNNSAGRLSWTNEEKDIIQKNAGTFLDLCKIPSLEFCENIREKEPSLKRRSVGTLKSFIANEIKKKKQVLLIQIGRYAKEVLRSIGQAKKQAEKKQMFTIFGEFIRKEKLPSLPFCRKIIQSNDILKDRTPEMLKAFISNFLKKNWSFFMV